MLRTLERIWVEGVKLSEDKALYGDAAHEYFIQQEKNMAVEMVKEIDRNIMASMSNVFVECKFEAIILNFDGVANDNGTKYMPDCKITYQEQVPVYLGAESNGDSAVFNGPTNILGYAKIFKAENYLRAVFNLDNNLDKLLSFGEALYLYPTVSGYGTVGMDGIISDLEIDYIDINFSNSDSRIDPLIFPNRNVRTVRAGDTVLVKKPIEGFITEGYHYKVIGIREEEDRIVITDDRGLEGWYRSDRFILLG